MSYPTRGETKSVRGWLVWVIAILFIIVAVVGVFGWFFGWLSVPGQVTSPDNVREQWRFAYDMEEDLEAAARQVCNAQVALDNAVDSNERQQRQSQLIARQDNYARIASDYNGRMRDAFRAGLVKPPDVREEALSLNEMVTHLRQSENLDCGES